MKFIITSPGYNATKWAMMNIGTVIGQQKNTLQIIVDDGGLTEFNNKVTNKLQEEELLIINKTPIKRGALASHIDIMNLCTSLRIKDEDVIVHLDLDDWLISPFALTVLEECYTKTNCWATYGNYFSSNGEPSICKQYINKFNRKTDCFNWFFSHLRTFKFGLWKHIRIESLLNKNNLPFDMAGDVAICSSLLELCPVDKIKFINYPMMVYNTNNINNESKLDLQLQQECVKEIISKEPHKELESY